MANSSPAAPTASSVPSTPATSDTSPAGAEARTQANRAAIGRIVWASSIPWFAVTFVVVFVALCFVNVIVAVVAALVVGAAVGIGRTLMLRAAVVTGLRDVFGGEPADPDRHARLVNLVEGLCISSGIAVPELRVIDEPGANIATFGPDGDGVVVVTSGLLSILGRVELEAVVAEALGRVDQADAELAGVVATFPLGSVLRSVPGPEGAVAGRLSTRAGAVASKAFVANRHFLADLDAVSATRYPPGMRAALVKLRDHGTVVASASWGTAPCWMCDPFSTSEQPEYVRRRELVGDHPSLTLRIDLMSEL